MNEVELDQVAAELEEMGPVDYILLAWPGGVPTGAGVVPMIINLVERGIIRVLDIAFVAKDADGNVAGMDLESLDGDHHFGEFAGASSGLLGAEDIVAAGEALDPD